MGDFYSVTFRPSNWCSPSQKSQGESQSVLLQDLQDSRGPSIPELRVKCRAGVAALALGLK